jgi:RNA polymerase sigma factor (sigma-70 family)
VRLAADGIGPAPELDHLADALAALPSRQRAVLVLRYYVGCSEAEIAAILDCRPGTVKSLASRALASLRGVLEP